MKRFWYHLSAVIAIGFLSLLPGSVAARQGNDSGTVSAAVDDESAVRTAIADLMRFEQDEDLVAYYDHLAPDARNLLQRDDWLEWNDLSPRLVPTADVTISDLTFESWTWPATDQTYEDVAIVHVQQTGTVDGEDVTRDEVLHFVQQGEGNRWRLLPLFSPGVIASTAAEQGTPLDYTSAFDDPTYAAIDTFWARNFAAAGLDSYESPPDVVETTRNAQISAGCGTATDIRQYGIYYCTLDETIYFSPDFRDTVVLDVGEWAWTDILAHEWGHHIQDLLGLDFSAQPELDGGFYTIELEQQADCMAGMYSQDEFAAGTIGQDEVDQAIEITGKAGDSADTNWDDPSAHGTDDQRQDSFRKGFDSGFGGCRVDLAA